METSQVTFRISVIALFIHADDVLLLHQTTLPEPDLWDLPGGGLHPNETLMEGLAREVREETGITEFQVDGLLTIVEGFYPKQNGGVSHTINIIYKCSLSSKLTVLNSSDPEVGSRGIQWLPIASLRPELFTTRTWKALQAVGDFGF